MQRKMTIVTKKENSPSKCISNYGCVFSPGPKQLQLFFSQSYTEKLEDHNRENYYIFQAIRKSKHLSKHFRNQTLMPKIMWVLRT